MAIQPFNQPQFGMQQQQQGQQPQTKRQRGTGFTNIGRMLGANVGAGQQMAQQVGKNIGAQAGQVQQGALKSQQAFKTGFEAAKEKGLEDISKVSGLAGQVGEAGQVGTNLSGMSEEEAKKLGQKFAETQYTGPMGLEGQVGQRAQSLKGLGQQALTGQRELIGSTLARRGPYTRGQSLLDVSLVGQDKAAQEALRASALEAMRTGAQAQQQEAAAKSLAEGAQALIGGDKKTGSLKAEVESQLTKSQENLKEAATKQAEEFIQEGKKFSDALTNLKNNPNDLSKDDIELLKKAEEFGVDLSTQVDSRHADLLKQTLGDISTTGNFTRAGGLYYTPEQQNALRNIQLFGQEKLNVPEFNKNLFASTAEESAKRIKEQHSKNISDIENRLVSNASRFVHPSLSNMFDPSVKRYDFLNPENKGKILQIDPSRPRIDQILLNEIAMYNHHAGTARDNDSRKTAANTRDRLISEYNKYKNEMKVELDRQKFGETLGDYLKSITGNKIIKTPPKKPITIK